VVSPEVRANCTLRICLRTTDEAESRDVLGSPEAAHLPLDVPGRAYLRAGTGDAVLLQVARVTVAPPADDDGVPEVCRRHWPPVTEPAPAESPVDKDTDLARLVRLLRRQSDLDGIAPPHRPWRPQLPDRLLPAESAQRTASGPDPTPLRIGLVDRPDAQAQDPLELDLREGGTWLAVGGPRSGRTTALRTVLGEAVHQLPPERLHVHLVEAAPGVLATEAAALPHTGTVVSADDALRTVRLVARLGEEVAARRAGTAADDAPHLLLLIDGIEAVIAVLDEADPAGGSAGLLRLLRDGAAVGLTAVVTADRAIPGGRLAAVAGQRLVLPLPDRADYAVAGIPAREVPAHRPPGRALVGEDALECQLALPRPPETRTSWPGPRSGTPPLRIPALPPDPVAALPGLDTPVGRGGLVLPIGPGGDDGAVLAVDLVRTRGLLVTGPPGSGRTAALEAFERHLRARGTPVLRLLPAGHPMPDRDTGDGGADAPPARLDASDEAGLRSWIDDVGGRPAVVVADDLGGPGECLALNALTGPAAARVVLVAAAAAGQLSAHFQGAVAALRRSRTGLLLCPGPGDADLLGIRLPRTPVPTRPGSGWLVTAGGVQRVQVARHRSRPDGGAP
jgi:S-DNA-T family DNA segregation ATPase FtsK/SpoIIIE